MILKSNPLYSDSENSDFKQVFDELWPQVETEVWAYDSPYHTINFPEQGGITGYFSRNINNEDLALIKEFLQSQGISILNTRAFKL